MTPKPKKTKKEEIAELGASIEEERRRAENYLKELKYAKADLENLQKRTQRQIEEATSRANGRILMQLLTILDELGLAVEAAKEANGNILEGVEMVRGKLEKLLDSEGVKPIEAVGVPFDPNHHEAVLEIETCDLPDGVVAEELRRGYLYKEKVLRASMVKVARNPGSEREVEVEEG
jgi:molecular chaperone GrpE